MEYVIKLSIIALVFAIVIVYMKSINGEISLVLTISASIIFLIIAVEMIGDTFSFFSNLAKISKIDENVIKIIIKIVLICYLSEFSIGIIEDFGIKSLADKLSLVSKLIVMAVAMPVLENLIEVIKSIL